MAVALGHIFGPWFKTGILLLMVDAAILGATAISLSWPMPMARCAAGPTGCKKTVKEAPGFYGTYVACVALAAGLVLIPRAPLQLIIVSVQVLAGVMLPSAIVFLQLLLNDRDLLGRQVGEQALEQRGELDDYRRPVRAVPGADAASGGTKPVPGVLIPGVPTL